MLTLCKPPRARQEKRTPSVVSEILRITEGDFVVGDVLLDDVERVLERGAGVPRDVVLKALVLYTRRNILIGEVVSRENGRTYAWDVLDEDSTFSRGSRSAVLQPRLNGNEHNPFSPLE